MEQEEQLLRAIVENPDDDAVRLVYADWLEENAEASSMPSPLARAEFIRLQIELSKLTEDSMHR